MTDTTIADHVSALTGMSTAELDSLGGLPQDAPAQEPTYEIVHGYLVEVVDEHTCGAGPGSGAGHEPDCGLVPIVSVERIFQMLKREVDEQAGK
jgi:hypothetical protein